MAFAMKTTADKPPILEDVAHALQALRAQSRLVLQSGDEGFASAPSNIALLKYWGKQPERKQIPLNSSLSLTLGHLRTLTRVRVVERFGAELGGRRSQAHTWCFIDEKKQVTQEECPSKTAHFLDAFLAGWADDVTLHVVTQNTFPTACGVASSASGFAALIGALSHLLDIKNRLSLTPSQHQEWLAHWARWGSGSALRSVALGDNAPFVGWESASAASPWSSLRVLNGVHQDFSHLHHALLVIDEKPKKVLSSQGHLAAVHSPLHGVRLAGTGRAYAALITALTSGDWNAVIDISERDAFAMHAVMLTGEPRCCYLNDVTSAVVAAFVAQRDALAARALWTLDAGPNIHFIYHESAQEFFEKFINETIEKYKKENKEMRVISGSSVGGLHLGDPAAAGACRDVL